MSDESEDKSSRRLVPFSGEHKDWIMWSRKFLASSSISSRDYKGILAGTETPPADSENLDLTKDEDKIKNRLRKANIRAYSDLLNSMEKMEIFGIVDSARSTELPEGDSRMAWKALVAKFEPKTAAEKVRMNREFTMCKMKGGNSDPDIWLTELERKRQRLRILGVTKTDDDIINHVLCNLPKEYEVTLEVLEEKLSQNELTMEILRDKLIARYDKLRDREEQEDDNEEEKALTVGQHKFKGNCRICGKIGHKAGDCWENEKNKDKRPKNWKAGGGRRAGPPSTEQSNSNNRGNRKFNGNCSYCHKYGHHINDCYTKKRNESANSANDSNETADHVLTVGSTGKGTSNMWIADSGATSHMTNTLEGMYDVREGTSTVKVGNSEHCGVVKIGKLRGMVQQKDGSTIPLVLTNVQYVPELWCNLYSLLAAIGEGYKLNGDLIGKDTILKVKKGSTVIAFDERIKGGSNDLLGMRFLREIPEAAMTNLEPGTNVKTVTLHNQLGHPSEAVTRITAKYLQVNATGKLPVCENCAMGKAKQKNLPKVSEGGSNIAGERLYIDISSIKEKSLGGSKFWLLVVDEATHMKWSFFLKNKSQTSEKLMPFLKELKAKYFKTVKFIRCDNAGENKTLERDTKNAGMGITFEYSAPGTPQQNAVVERAFATLMGRVRAMMNLAGFTKVKRNQLWTEAAATATKVENMLVYKNGESHAYKKFLGPILVTCVTYAHSAKLR